MIIKYNGNSQKIDSCISYFNDLILNKLYDNEISCWIAGGSIRSYIAGERIYDIDVFFPNEENFEKSKEMFSNDNVLFENENVIKIDYKRKTIDLIKKYFPDEISCLDNFDFTVACALIKDNKFYHHENFFIDLSSKSLVINALPFPLSTLRRLQKYIKRGYHACNGTFLEIAKEIQKLDLDDPSENSFLFYPDGTPRFIKFD